jgi:hypothetical protein
MSGHPAVTCLPPCASAVRYVHPFLSGESPHKARQKPCCLPKRLSDGSRFPTFAAWTLNCLMLAPYIAAARSIIVRDESGNRTVISTNIGALQGFQNHS